MLLSGMFNNFAVAATADAGVWVSEAGPIRYALEVAKANATHTTPDIGERRDINLH